MKKITIKREKLNIKSDWGSESYILYANETVSIPFTTVANTYGIESIVVLKENIKNIAKKENQTINFDIDCLLWNSTSENNIIITIHNKTTNEDLIALSFKLENGFETEIIEKFKDIYLSANTTYNIILSSSITGDEKIEIFEMEAFMINKFHQIESSMVINDAASKPLEGINPSLLQIEKNQNNIKENKKNIGDLDKLHTERKSNLVNTINEIYSTNYNCVGKERIAVSTVANGISYAYLNPNKVYVLHIYYSSLGSHDYSSGFPIVTNSSGTIENHLSIPIIQPTDGVYKGYIYIYSDSGNRIRINNYVAYTLQTTIYKIVANKD